MSSNAPVASAPKAGAREWAGLAVLALPTLLISLDQSVLFLALPHLAEAMDPSGTQALWIMDVYGFMVAGFLVTMGTLGDRIGRRKLLMIGAVCVSVTSVTTAYSTSAEVLIATRALLGISAATLMPSTLALISNMFHDAHQRGRAIAVWASCFMAGTALGPVVGGTLLEFFWWGSVFLLGVPVMVILLVAAPILLPEYRDPGGGKLDLLSVVLSLATILPVVYGLKELARYGWEPLPSAAMLVGVVLGAAFVARQRKLTHPLLDMRLFSSGGFTSALVILLFSMIATGGSYLFITGFLQMVEGLSPMEAGLWMVPSALASIVAGQLAPVMTKRFPLGVVIAVGLGSSMLGYVLIAYVSPVGGLPLLVAGFVIAFFGGGPIGALGTSLVVGSAPPEKAGSAAALSSISGDLGASLGIAGLGSLGAAVYRSELDLPAGLPTGAAETARGGMEGALTVAQQLPAEMGGKVLAAARDAYTSGLNTVGVACAVLAAVLAFTAATVLRGAGAGRGKSPEEEGPGPERPGQDETPAPPAGGRLAALPER
ncbi:MFS transporter [Streptomyces sp. ISL-96]|uniref:MFS transporter n=1 Tax=Streptomyces sp. ISL-96 TaxID=2819191 RepID=UPI001BEA3350|nr:MFS transporter [Streptomyces sp. ISL-96]MBT2493613.1 MFS transporter [Streptomyces sp. ISL-96]